MTPVPRSPSRARYLALAGALLATSLSAWAGAGCQHKVIAFDAINPRAARKALERTSELRELRPLRPIHFSLISTDALAAEVKSDLREDERSGFYSNNQKALPLLGLVHPDVDIRSVYESMYTADTLGYYDSRREVMRLVPRPIMRTEIVEIVAAVRGRDHLYGEALSHELTHALTDQHFDLDALMDTRGGGSDGSLARRCLVEGDASLVGHRYGGVLFKKVEKMVRFIKKRLPAIYEGKGVPRYFRERWVFPYLDGLLFVNAVYEKGGWKAVNAAYTDPPVSSEMILHPEKYLDAPRDLPRGLEAPDAEHVLGDGWKPIFDDVLGELGARETIAPWLGLKEATAAAAGWDGDRAVVFEGRDAVIAIWRSVWDDEKEAKEAATSLRDALVKRREKTGPLTGAVFVKRDEVLLIVGDIEAAGGDASAIAAKVWAPPPESEPAEPASKPAAGTGP